MKRPRFRLRTLMAAVVASAILFAWVREQGSVHYALISAARTIFPWSLSFVVAFELARLTLPGVRGTIGRRASSAFAFGVLVACLYSIWAYQRTVCFGSFDFGRGFPYPDPAIDALALWLDARHPASPGSFKLHGEYQRIAACLWKTILTLASLDGLLLGLLAIPTNVPEALPLVGSAIADRTPSVPDEGGPQ